MQLTLKRLGIISDGLLELRPLTLIVGPNNTNKSWTAYGAYALLKSLCGRAGFPSQSLAKNSRGGIVTRIRRLAKEAARQAQAAPESAAISLQYSRDSILGDVHEPLSVQLSADALARVLAVPPSVVTSSSITLAIPNAVIRNAVQHLTISIDKKRRTLSYAYSRRPLPEGVTLEPSVGQQFETLRTDAGLVKMVFSTSDRLETNWDDSLFAIVYEFITNVYDSCIALPAERKALASLYRILPKRRVVEGDEPPHLPLPAEDFAQLLANSESWHADSGDKTVSSKWTPQLASVVGGTLLFNHKGAGGHLSYSPADGVALPIQSTSSLVRSMAGFAIALEHFRGGRSVLVVDEPEMNAHPAAQLAIVELMATLAAQGVMVLATTHSPYVVDHVNNLLAAGRLKGNARKEAAHLFALRSSECFLPASSVSVYQVDDSGTVSSLLSRGTIKPGAIGQVSSRLENLYSRLISLAADSDG